ncbi:MAG: C-terminal binding protein [Salinispira sp.]
MLKNMKCVATDFSPVGSEWGSERLGAAGIEFCAFQLRGGSPALLLRHIADADVVIVDQAQISAEVISGLTNCALIIRNGDGYDNVDVDAASTRGIVCINKPGFWSREVAEQTLALTLSLLRNLPRQQEAARSPLINAGWDVSLPIAQKRLSDLTAGIIGFGRIGAQAAELFSAVFARVLVYSPSLSPVPASANATQKSAPPASANAASADAVLSNAGRRLPWNSISVSLDELRAESDVVSLHLPASGSSIGMVSADFFAGMKRGACLINTARGSLVNTDALLAALRSGQLGGAALDVTSPEPLPAGHPLLGMSNVIVVPHMAWYSETSLRNMRVSIMDDVLALAQGRLPAGILNPQVLHSAQFRLGGNIS